MIAFLEVREEGYWKSYSIFQIAWVYSELNFNCDVEIQEIGGFIVVLRHGKRSFVNLLRSFKTLEHSHLLLLVLFLLKACE